MVRRATLVALLALWASSAEPLEAKASVFLGWRP